MIDADVFIAAWGTLERRFHRDMGDDVAVEYKTALDAVLGTEQFVRAARVVFFEREFFPRPADFLEAAVRVEWERSIRGVLLRVPQMYASVEDAMAWQREYQALPDFIRGCIAQAGGAKALAVTLNVEPMKAEQLFLSAATRKATTLAAERALGPGNGPLGLLTTGE